MCKGLVIAFAALIGAMLLAADARAATLCPDGTYVSGPRCVLAADGSYVSGGTGFGSPRLAPDGTFVPGTPRITPGGNFVGGPGRNILCPDGTFVTGSRCELTPNGRYVGK